MVVVMMLVLEQQHYREGGKVVMGKEPVVELEYDKVVEKLVLVHMEKAAFLSALVGSEVAYSAAQATVAILSEAYKITKNHRSFPRNTSLQGATLHNNHNCNLKHWCGQFQLVPLSTLILPDVTMLY
ncbi:SWI/SNF complex subunit SWI3B [Arachis hypogaea]|nr:SWI/SNF complex subunit SWI3B [Arachis hypogaea]